MGVTEAGASRPPIDQSITTAAGNLHMTKSSLSCHSFLPSRLIPCLHCPDCVRSAADELFKTVMNGHDYLMRIAGFSIFPEAGGRNTEV